MRIDFVTLWVPQVHLSFVMGLNFDSIVPSLPKARTGEKDKLDAASGPEYYHQVHQKHHPTCSRAKA